VPDAELDACGREQARGREEIVEKRVGRHRPPKRLDHLRAIGGLGRRLGEVPMFEERTDDFRNECAACRNLATGVKVRPARIMAAHQPVANAVTGARVERDHLVNRCACGNVGDVRDAADIDEHTRDRRMAKQDVVREWHEWCALSAGGEIGAAEIADDGAADFGGEERGIEPLDRVGRIVEERLPVRGDGGEVLGLHLRRGQRFVHRRRIGE
jgi:hypothetical protein